MVGYPSQDHNNYLNQNSTRTSTTHQNDTSQGAPTYPYSYNRYKTEFESHQFLSGPVNTKTQIFLDIQDFFFELDNSC